ncbi:MAG: VanZ family protein [Anaerolineae bacterium]|nr:VanZ family protein [Phycisphaerae bacterium]
MGRTRSWKDTLGKRDFTAKVERGGGGSSIVERKLARLLVAGAMFAVLFCGLFPFDLVFRGAGAKIERRFDWTFTQYFTSGDTPENILFFTPLGFALGALLLRGNSRTQQIIAGVLTVLTGASLSVIVEILQCLLGERDPSVTDIANNTIGAAVGFGVYLFVGRQFLSTAAMWIERTERKLGPATLGTITGLFALAICLVPLIKGAESGSLSNWLPTYSLAVGNELGDKRLWFGNVSNVLIASHAATDAQLDAIFSARKPEDIFGTALIGHYDLRGEPPFVDRAGHLPPLDLPRRVATQPTRTARPAPTQPIFPHPTTATRPTTLAAVTRPIDPTALPWDLGPETWLRTGDPVDLITRELTTSNAFTIAITASSARPDQFQTARLMTISAGAHHRNFTIGQDSTNLIVRVRTGVTGENGSAPEFVLADVFADETPRRIVVTFADALLKVFIDGKDWSAQARLTPEAAVIWAMYPRDYWKFQMDSNDSARLALIYRAISFLPLGVLCAATVNLLQRRRRERVIIVLAILAATIVLMEALITTLSSERFAISNVIVSALAASAGVFIVKIRSESPWLRTR